MAQRSEKLDFAVEAIGSLDYLLSAESGQVDNFDGDTRLIGESIGSAVDRAKATFANAPDDMVALLFVLGVVSV